MTNMLSAALQSMQRPMSFPNKLKLKRMVPMNTMKTHRDFAEYRKPKFVAMTLET